MGGKITPKNGGDSSTIGTSIASSLKGMVLKFFAVQTVLKTMERYLKFQNEIANKISGGILNLGASILKSTGLTPSTMLENAMDFESVRATMNVLAKSTEKGAEVYANATQLAKKTAFSEKDTTEMAQYVLKANLLPTMGDLEQLGNMASTKPELGAGHAGFAVFDWLNGLVTSLKRNYGIDNETLRAYLKTLPDKKEFSKAFNSKGAVGDKEQAFNLLMRFIKDNYDGLAITQSNTLRGLVSTVGGQFMQYGSDLMGLNSQTGEVSNERGVFQQLKNFLGKMTKNEETGELESTGFMKVLDDFVESDAFKRLSDALGNITKSVLDIVSVAVNSENIEKFANMLANIGNSASQLGQKFQDLGIMQEIIDVLIDVGNEFADFIGKFSESDQYESILKSLPELVKQSLEYEMAKLNFAMSMAQYIPTLTKFMEKTTNFVDWVSGGVSQAVEEDTATGDSYGAKIEYAKLTGTKGGKFLVSGDEYRNGYTQDLNVSDFNVQRYLKEKGSDMGLSEEQISEYINKSKNDNKPTYDIKLEYKNGTLDAEAVKKVILQALEEADSNN